VKIQIFLYIIKTACTITVKQFYIIEERGNKNAVYWPDSGCSYYQTVD
jgi:hypothetical protein